MFSPLESAEIVELLFMTAHYHRTGSHLGLGHTVNFGKPWLDASICDHGLISLPYLDGPKLENLKVGFVQVKFLWLIPVTKEEVSFKKKHGLDALEEQFDLAKLDYASPNRQSVIREIE